MGPGLTLDFLPLPCHIISYNPTSLSNVSFSFLNVSLFAIFPATSITEAVIISHWKNTKAWWLFTDPFEAQVWLGGFSALGMEHSPPYGYQALHGTPQPRSLNLPPFSFFPMVLCAQTIMLSFWYFSHPLCSLHPRLFVLVLLLSETWSFFFYLTIAHIPELRLNFFSSFLILSLDLFFFLLSKLHSSDSLSSRHLTHTLHTISD